jgi:hypothetical protein
MQRVWGWGREMVGANLTNLQFDVYMEMSPWILSVQLIKNSNFKKGGKKETTLRQDWGTDGGSLL